MTTLGAIMVDDQDNVATVLENMEPDHSVAVKSKKSNEAIKSLKVLESIPVYHKIAVEKIQAGEKVIKYGAVIGTATKEIEIGEHVHTHNIKSLRG